MSSCRAVCLSARAGQHAGYPAIFPRAVARERLLKLTYPDHRTVRETDIPDVSTINDDRLFSSLWDLRYRFGPVRVL